MALPTTIVVDEYPTLYDEIALTGVTKEEPTYHIYISQCLLTPTGGVSKGHKPTIDTDSSVDPVPDTCINCQQLSELQHVPISLWCHQFRSLNFKTYVSNTVTGIYGGRERHTRTMIRP
jgi:hypothetical protein